MRQEVEVEFETDVIILRSSKTPLAVMMKMRMLTKFILNIMKVVKLVEKSWN